MITINPKSMNKVNNVSTPLNTMKSLKATRAIYTSNSITAKFLLFLIFYIIPLCIKMIPFPFS